MTLSEKIQKLRKSNNLSQEQLAAELNVSRQSVSKWELGAAVPELDKLRLLSHFFGVSADYLLNDEWEEDRPAVQLPLPRRKRRIWPLLLILLGSYLIPLIFVYARYHALFGWTELRLYSYLYVFAGLPILACLALLYFVYCYARDRKS
jgi:transcriptional regulator with XRE-family HTH domain